MMKPRYLGLPPPEPGDLDRLDDDPVALARAQGWWAAYDERERDLKAAREAGNAAGLHLETMFHAWDRAKATGRPMLDVVRGIRKELH